MVATVGSISIDLSTNAARFSSGFRSSATTVERESNRMRRSVNRVDSAMASGIARIGAYGKALVAAFATREVVRYADAWTEANNQIRAAAEITGVQVRSLEDLNDIANKTRAGISETAALYARLVRSAGNVVKSEEDLARVTEIVNKAFKAGGAAASEQAAGILQLSQALGSGLLQGDELRSLRENAPLLAQAIADEFNTTIAGLKQLGADGELTAERLIQAFLRGAPKIEGAFDQTSATIGDGVTLIRNAVAELVGTFDRVTGTSAGAVDALTKIAGTIDRVTDAIRDFESGSKGEGIIKLVEVITRLNPLIAAFGGTVADEYTNATTKFLNALVTAAEGGTEVISNEATEAAAYMQQLQEEIRATEARLFALEAQAESTGFVDGGQIATAKQQLAELRAELAKTQAAYANMLQAANTAVSSAPRPEAQAERRRGENNTGVTVTRYGQTAKDAKDTRERKRIEEAVNEGKRETVKVLDGIEIGVTRFGRKADEIKEGAESDTDRIVMSIGGLGDRFEDSLSRFADDFTDILRDSFFKEIERRGGFFGGGSNGSGLYEARGIFYDNPQKYSIVFGGAAELQRRRELELFQSLGLPQGSTITSGANADMLAKAGGGGTKNITVNANYYAPEGESEATSKQRTTDFGINLFNELRRI